MKTKEGRSDELKKDLSTLRIDYDKLEILTVQEVRAAYHKVALDIHPDKADPKNKEQVAKFTADFQELGNCYQRVLKHIIENSHPQGEDPIEAMDDEALFAKEHFDKFNFPFENSGSFTVSVEDNLAEAWQDSLKYNYFG